MQELSYLAPNQQICFFLANAIDIFERKIGKPFTITARYKNAIGHVKSDSFSIEFERFIGMEGLGEPPIYGIAKSIQEIQKDLRKLVDSNKLRVKLWTQEDVKAEREANLTRHRQQVGNSDKPDTESSSPSTVDDSYTANGSEDTKT